jgi:hypothetical protein
MTKARTPKDPSQRSKRQSLGKYERTFDLSQSLSKAFEPAVVAFYDCARLSPDQYACLREKSRLGGFDSAFVLLEVGQVLRTK